MSTNKLPECPPIGDYAAIGDCCTLALVSKSGSIDWLCLPHFSSPSIFARLLDQRIGGQFAVSPVGEFTVSRKYIEDTAVLETTFTTASGIVRLTDLMVLAPGRQSMNRLIPHRELLRIIEGVEGEVELEVLCNFRPDYARAKPHLRQRGKLGWFCESQGDLWVLYGDVPLDLRDGKVLDGSLKVSAGEKRYLSLTYVHRHMGVVLPVGAEAEARLTSTVDWWQGWSKRCTYEGPYKDMVLRSMLTLKLLTYALSGAVVAAGTTSLPERGTDGKLNWDYRYCWLRDAGLTVSAFDELGYRPECEAFANWIIQATRMSRPKIQIMYDVHGKTNLEEQELEHLEGFCGWGNVRIGNGAYQQVQLDVYGELALAAYEAVQRGWKLNSEERLFLKHLGKVVSKEWVNADQGIWEERGPPKHWTFSKVMCWVALDRLVKLHEQGHLKIPVDKFRRTCELIREAVEVNGYNEAKQSYTQTFDGEEIDACLLLMANHGYCEPNAPRLASTWKAIERELCSNELGHSELIYRDNAALPSREESPFGVTSFWAVDYLARAGKIEEARQRFERLLSYANDVGLYAEELDAETGRAVGNFPQAFTHVGLITAALALARCSQDKQDKQDHQEPEVTRSDTQRALA